MEKTAAALALFDFDGTMLHGDSIVAYLKLATRLKATTRRDYWQVVWHTFRYVLGRETDEQVKTRALRFRERVEPMRLEALDRIFVEEKLIPNIYPEAMACLRHHQEEGKIALLVTASTENYMRYVGEVLGFDAVLSTPVEGLSYVTHNCKGEEKPRRIREYLEKEGLQADFAASYAYGDSKSDWPMLKMCGHPVLVNPKKGLREIAPTAPKVSWGRD